MFDIRAAFIRSVKDGSVKDSSVYTRIDWEVKTDSVREALSKAASYVAIAEADGEGVCQYVAVTRG